VGPGNQENDLIRMALRNPDCVVRRVLGPPIERRYSRFLFAKRLGAIPEKPRKSGRVRVPEKSHRKVSLSGRHLRLGSFDGEFQGLSGNIGHFLPQHCEPRQKSEKPEKIGKSPKIRTSNPDITKPLWIEADIDPSFFIRGHTASACQI